MGIPKSIKICGKEFKISKKTDMRHGKKYIWGRVNIAKGIIHIDSRLSTDNRKETLLHECIHAIDEHMGTRLSEKQIERLSRGIFSFLKESKFRV